MKDSVYNQSQLDREVEALRREHDGKIEADREAQAAIVRPGARIWNHAARQ